MTITFYKGRRGSGKTCTMVKDAYKDYLNGLKVYTNMDLTFGVNITSDFILSLDRSSVLSNCVLVIDEIELFFDSRGFTRQQSVNFSNFLQQIRKRNIKIRCTAQYSNLIDLRVRQQIDFCVMPSFNKSSLYCSCVVYDLTSFELSSVPVSISYKYYAKPVFKLYDTHQLIV